MLTSEAGNEFSNNLFSDLAPILALFGERVTQQYLSHTSSIWECVIFACAPIGIITAVVAAIRVGGTGSLKAIIGRAREPKADVELELMSSTSLDVCELWSDGGVARLGGTLPNIVEILVRDRSSKRRCLELFTLESAIREGLYTCNSIEKQEPHLQQMEALSGNRADLEEIRTEVRMTPNLSFNLAGGTPSKGELIPIAVIGIVLQLGVIILAGSSAYSPGLRQKIADMDIPAYAFPMFAVGTLFICIGMFICAYVVDHSTEDLVWEPDTRFQLHKLLWLQKGSFVGDQEFRSYIISARADHIRRGEVLTSRRVQRRPDSTSGNLRALVSPPMLTVVGTCFSISGFISQFIGLRALH
ncbi:hypothetical protein BJ508DRAFT_128500 [Ascobolus immersus RN42]|uniref:Uncharacterized protein n=1 Tax=Ascobolus immersus RN42 TaxID=1160509 RepID=A0A3N4I8V4_ASCIM|nr:hypothetical protein BJ508DRAFT_128500 [Ascobolus immersus RN42]